MNDIYWVKQRGDNCRIHSINAFFGEKKISDREFYDFCDRYDKIIPGLKSRKMDGFAEARCIISHILSEIGEAHTILIPINKYTGARDHLDLVRYDKMVNNLEITSYFEFNPTHVWLNKYIEDKKCWYRIDSLSGLTRIDPRINFNKNGIILVIDQKNTLGNELVYYIKKLTGDKELDELVLYNLFHSINVFLKKDIKFPLLKLKSMKKYLDNFVNKERFALLKNLSN